MNSKCYIQSMTGFGIALAKNNDLSCEAEIKSLNSKIFDFKLNINENLQFLEPKIKSIVQEKLKRGRINLTIKINTFAQFYNITINDDLFNKYISAIKCIKKDFVLNDNNIIDFLKYPDIIIKDTNFNNIKTIESILISAISEAVDKCIKMRCNEGKNTASVLKKEINNISKYVKIIKSNKNRIIKKIQDNFNQKIANLLNTTITEEIEKRIILEIAFYIEKSDISEEIARLESHLKQFNQTVCEKEDIEKGKKLNFLMQEFLRETNTIASKSNDIDISTNTIEIKNSIEKIKEQLFNIL